MTIGEEMKKVREEQGLSIRQLAIKVGVSDSYLSAIERDIKVPTSDFIVKISEALDMNLLGVILAHEKNEEKRLIKQLIDFEIKRYGIKELNKYERLELEKNIENQVNEKLLAITTGLPEGTGLMDTDKM